MVSSKAYRDSHREEIRAYQLKYRLAHGQQSEPKSFREFNGFNPSTKYRPINEGPLIVYCKVCSYPGRKTHCVICGKYKALE